MGNSSSGQEIAPVSYTQSSGYVNAGFHSVADDDGSHINGHAFSTHRPATENNNIPNGHHKDQSSSSPLKRRLSSGDKPYWLSNAKKHALSVVESFYLGRSGTPTFALEEDQASTWSVQITEVAPTDETFLDDETGSEWRMSLDHFTSKRQGKESRRKSADPKRIRTYYKRQDSLIEAFEELRRNVDTEQNVTDADMLRKKASLFAKITLLCNIFLLAIKVAAVVMSGSISLISSLVDSAVDLVSGAIIWITTRAVKKRDPYMYPQGRTKLEPLAIVILSVIMSVASLQLIKESVTKIVDLSNDPTKTPEMNFVTIGIASATVVIKFVLYILCRRVPHGTIQALAQDHRNDVLSNAVAILFGYLGSQDMQANVDAPDLIYIDPIGAILISLYIAVNWWKTGYEQIKLLTGHTADPEFLSKITWLCVNHHRKIQCVDTVRAFHFGNHFLVEVDIVLPQGMTLKEAHDIGEPLQQKLEALPNVERAFVHIDYETTHDPRSEHKIV